MTEPTINHDSDRLRSQVQQGLAAVLMFATVGLGLIFVVWFHWALVMRLTAI